MLAKQHIFRVRRTYNQWVNDETLEDYALRFTANRARRWSLARVANTALGAISFLALEAIGAAMTLSYGFENTLAATLVVGLIIFFMGLPICFYAAKYGVDIDLLTRGAGFGYLGSTATSLIYASFTFIFFALEAAIMAKALELSFGLPLEFGYIISSLVVIPLVFFGVTFISRFQLWTQPLWIILHLTPFIFLFFIDDNFYSTWIDFPGLKNNEDGINIIFFGACCSILFSLVAQIGEQVDFLRFLPQKTKKNHKRWWAALVIAGPGWIVLGCIKILIGSYLAVIALDHFKDVEQASDPTLMYTLAFGFITDNHNFALCLAVLFVVISQLKINVTNAYAGSIAWSNFFSRLTHNHPGRVVWLVFNVAIALLLMELGIYQAFESTLSAYAIVAVSWVSALVADLVINKPLGFSPKHIEFKRAHLFDINPVGIGSMLLASVFGIFAYLGGMGEIAQALSHFIAMLSAFICAPIIAWATSGRYYIARKPLIFPKEKTIIDCIICQNEYEKDDMAFCPAYDGSICSLCCSLDARCEDSCKPKWFSLSTAVSSLSSKLPKYIQVFINMKMIHFIFLLSIVSGIIGMFLLIIYTHSQTLNPETNSLLAATLWNVFFVLSIISGVISWLYVLAHQSRGVAQQESLIQTQRLFDEIKAHEVTDRQLQQAIENAETANNAKSRYLTGISHELRSPLNTMLGYAQLLESDTKINFSVREKIVRIKRSGEHLSDLIEGLLDISKIEAGRLDIARKPILFNEFISDITDTFTMQAANSGLDFTYKQHSALPSAVIGDEKRIRQILLNILTNAIKFTETGGVTFSIRYRNQVAEFKVIDTGVGIDKENLERIFRPFERIRLPEHSMTSGTGLGLTITRLLTDIMGGDIQVESQKHVGTIFTVSLMLAFTEPPKTISKTNKVITGYKGRKKSVMVVDDDATHRGLISELLTPIGFQVVEMPDAESCLNSLNQYQPEIFLIDRKMPGMDGPTLALRLRQLGFSTPIIMVTANANEDTLTDDELNDHTSQNDAYDDYMIKPISLERLLNKIALHLLITWKYKEENTRDYLLYKVKRDLHSENEISLSEQQLESHLKRLNKTVHQELIKHLRIGNINQFIKLWSSSKAEINTQYFNYIMNAANNMNVKVLTKIFKVNYNAN